jgi:hypothetical protein
MAAEGRKIGMWTYYRQSYVNGDWSLFREDGNIAERYHRQKGWLRDTENDLAIRRYKGDIDSDDIISEEQALAMIRTLPPQQPQSGSAASG